MLIKLNFRLNLRMNNKLSHWEEQESVSLQGEQRLNLIDCITIIYLMLLGKVFVDIIPLN